MPSSPEVLTGAAAATRLGVSSKALRLYEARGLLRPERTAKGWRLYTPDVMRRAAEIVELRTLGLGLGDIARMVDGGDGERETILAAHQARLDARSRAVADARSPRGRTLAEPALAFDLPWLWGGERFALERIAPLTFITGPLGSGKTRLAERIADAIPGAVFLGLDRPAATPGALIDMLEADGPTAIVVDMVEQGLDEAAQHELAAWLRGRPHDARPLFLMTRSSLILDLKAVGPDTPILFCPANHAPPMIVRAMPGMPGHEGVATCLARPDVRARTADLVVTRCLAA